MKTKIIATVIFIIFTLTKLFAQPLPPSTPDGNAVPIGGLGILLLIGSGLILVINKKKK